MTVTPTHSLLTSHVVLLLVYADGIFRQMPQLSDAHRHQVAVWPRLLIDIFIDLLFG